jgi:hypothetical protein
LPGNVLQKTPLEKNFQLERPALAITKAKKLASMSNEPSPHQRAVDAGQLR